MFTGGSIPFAMRVEANFSCLIKVISSYTAQCILVGDLIAPILYVIDVEARVDSIGCPSG
jgi:hypothetical protein